MTWISLLESGAFSDLKITCNGRAWNAYKCILAVRCSFFGDYVNIGIFFDDTHLGGVVRHKRSSPLSSLMDDFSDHINAPAAKLRWLYNVKHILPSETLDTPSMQDGDCLYVVVEEQSADSQTRRVGQRSEEEVAAISRRNHFRLGAVRFGGQYG
jgi:hypothetical protein